MFEEDANYERTIMDYLNEDCWRAVLKYVPALDLIRTERTSRQWQTTVLKYLQGLRLSIGDDQERPKTFDLILSKEDYDSFATWTRKLGPSVVSAYCYSLETLKIVQENCPNLESLLIVNMANTVGAGEVLPYNLNKDFKCLKGLSFYACSVSDNWINQFIANKALEELEFNECGHFKGDFLNTINLSQLKSFTLHLRLYEDFNFERFLSAVEHLGELTKLALTVNNRPYRLFEVETEIQYVLHQMPKLEYLEINNNNIEIKMVCKDYGPLSSLTRLQHLQVAFRLSNKAVEAVLRKCKNLRTLGLSDCSALSERSVSALCRWGTRLRSLSLVGFEELLGDDIVAIVKNCPELMTLELIEVYLSADSLANMSAARRAVRPGVRLRLVIDRYTSREFLMVEDGNQYKMKYEDLDITFN